MMVRTWFCFIWAITFRLSATQVIANWDVVPDQRIFEPFEVGVVAFHESGVKVVFAVNGKEVSVVETPRMNPRTGVVEYFFVLDPAAYPEGALSLSAEAHPLDSAHESRLLSEITLYAHAGEGLPVETAVWADAENGSDERGDGSESAPYASIRKAVNEVADGGIVYLKVGKSYKLEPLRKNKSGQWTTISAAPGLTADEVHILTYGSDKSSTGRYGSSHIRWRNVSLYCDRNSSKYGNIFYFEKGSRTWFDGAVLYDAAGRWNNTHPFNGQGSTTYLTDTLIRDVTNAGGNFQRNVKMKDIGSDIYRAHSGLTAINVEIDTIDRGQTDAHPDFFQLYSPGKVEENLIFYNVKVFNMGAQGIFGGKGELRDAAFVNLLLEKRPEETPLLSQLTGKWTHILFWSMTIDAQGFLFRETEGLTDIDVRNCIFHKVSPNRQPMGHIYFTSCHYSSGDVLGENITAGDPMFLSREDSDYRVQANSPAYHSGWELPGVPADIDGIPYAKGTRNRGAFASANPGRE